MEFYKKDMKKYSNLEEWLDDLDMLHEHPNDKTLLNAIEERINNSNIEVITSIKNYLYNFLLDEDNALYAIYCIMADYPDCFLLIKEEDDPWFGPQ